MKSSLLSKWAAFSWYPYKNAHLRLQMLLPFDDSQTCGVTESIESLFGLLYKILKAHGTYITQKMFDNVFFDGPDITLFRHIYYIMKIIIIILCELVPSTLDQLVNHQQKPLVVIGIGWPSCATAALILSYSANWSKRQVWQHNIWIHSPKMMRMSYLMQRILYIWGNVCTCMKSAKSGPS